jgi:hypothetical protein
MYDNATRDHECPARDPDAPLSIDRERILARADAAFYAVAQTFLSEFEAEEPELYPEPDVEESDPNVYETDDGRTIAADGGTVNACPHCDSTYIRSRVGQNFYNADPCDGSFYCKDCQRYFDEPVERERRQSNCRRGLAADLAAASADDLATDGGRDQCRRCGGSLADPVEPGYGVECPRCGLGNDSGGVE